MTLALARRPATLDDLVVLVIDATGSDRTAQLSVSVAEQLERRHFVREVRPCTGTAPPVVDPSVAVIVTEEATGDLAVSIAAELEQQGVPTVVLGPSDALQANGSSSDVELWFVSAPDPPLPLPLETVVSIELALCADPYQIVPSDADGPNCDC
jgi:hypothetical protein